jgi:actin-related protein
MKRVLPAVIADLRHKKMHLIDEKAVQQVKEGKVGFKTFNAANALNTYQDGHNICYSDLTKNPYDADLYQSVRPEKF